MGAFDLGFRIKGFRFRVCGVLTGVAEEGARGGLDGVEVRGCKHLRLLRPSGEPVFLSECYSENYCKIVYYLLAVAKYSCSKFLRQIKKETICPN